MNTGLTAVIVSWNIEERSKVSFRRCSEVSRVICMHSKKSRGYIQLGPPLQCLPTITHYRARYFARIRVIIRGIYYYSVFILIECIASLSRTYRECIANASRNHHNRLLKSETCRALTRKDST